ncbi:MAG: ABC transporter permease [Actinomycetes bacterium]
MPTALAVPLALAAAGFRRWSTYRSAVAAGIFVNSVFGYVRSSILLAAATAAGGSFAGYDPSAVVTYTFLGQALIAVVHVFGWNELALRVRTGDIAVDLARPVDLQLAWLAADLGRAALQLLARGVPTMLLGVAFVTVGLPAAGSDLSLQLPATPALAAAFVLSMGLAVTVSFAARFLLNLVAFWTVEIRGFLSFYVLTSNLLMGLVVPVQAFPDGVRALVYATPFPAMLQAPIDVWTGRGLGPSAAGTLAVQAGWAAALLLLGRWVLSRGTRRLVVQGG